MTENLKHKGVVEWSEEDQCFIGQCPGLVGPCCHGDTFEEVDRELRLIIGEWLEIDREDEKIANQAQRLRIASFSEKVKYHLGEYRQKTLGVEEEGTHNGTSYQHILPRELFWLNLIETFRAEARQSLEDSGLRLNQYFHHLNSTQAACLNLFWPLLDSAGSHVLLDSLGIGPDKVLAWEFDKVMDKDEKTRFDLYLELGSGAKVFFDFKYAGKAFRGVKANAQRREKLRNLYAPALKDVLLPKYLEEESFFDHYEILRSFLYMDPGNHDYVVFVLPQGNEGLVKKIRNVLGSAIKKPVLRSSIVIRYLEDFVADVQKRLSGDEHLLRSHLDLYKEKYFV